MARALLAGWVATGLACTLPTQPAPEPPPPALAGLSVEIHGGLARGQGWSEAGLAPAAAIPVEMVLDATLSMAQSVSGRVTRSHTARQLAVRYLGALPAETPVSLRVPGITVGSACGPAVPIAATPGRPPAESLAALIPALPTPRGESSLAAALEDVARGLARSSQSVARVVVLSDFEPDCGGDVCAAAQALVEAGVELEIVDLGTAPAPACLDALVNRNAPASLARLARPPVPAFRVERPVAGEEGAGSFEPLGRGRADSGLLSVSAGRVVVTVELDPPVAVGPLDLGPGETARIRVLEFPGLDPPVREVWVEGGARTDDGTRAGPREIPVRGAPGAAESAADADPDDGADAADASDDPDGNHDA